MSFAWTDVAGLALGLAAIVILARIVRCWLKNPRAYEETGHDREKFGPVMAGRYIFFGLMLLGAMVTLNLLALAFVFACLSFLGFFDAVIYKEPPFEPRKHFQAGVASAVAAIICLALFVVEWQSEAAANVTLSKPWIFVFVSVVTLTVTGGISALMLRDPDGGILLLKHRHDQLPEVMTGRYILFFTLTVLAVAYGDFLVMLGLQISFVVASLSDTWIYARRGHPYASHLMAGFASAVAACLCGYALLAA